jgi:cytochrome c oxidase assembly factor CtaG
MALPRTSILNNLTSPEARGSLGTVAQEEAINKTTPPNKTVNNIDLIEITSFYHFPFFFLFISRSTTLFLLRRWHLEVNLLAGVI